MKSIIIVIVLVLAFFTLITKTEMNNLLQKTDPPASGNQLYVKYCLTCHQEDGKGVRSMYPPLAGNEKVTGPSKDLIMIVLFGLEGPIEVNGRDYNQVMPAQDYLNDNQISGILSFIRSSWGNKASPVTPDEIDAIRKQGKPAN